MARHKDGNWTLGATARDGLSWDQVQVAVLMDIRDELKQLNKLLHCPNFMTMPAVLRRIDKRLEKRIKLR